jgi:hypothetical protein
MDDSGDRDTTIATGGTGDGGFSRDASGEVSASGGITTDGAGGKVDNVLTLPGNAEAT